MTEIIDIVEPYITGPQGPGGTIESATAVGLAPGAEPTVTLGGTPEQRTIEFGIPEGEQGAPATITSATAETLPPQSAATVTVGGTPSARTFAFGIPKGDPGSGSVNSVNGDPGPDVVLGPADVGAVRSVNGKTNTDVALLLSDIQPDAFVMVTDYGAIGDGVTDDTIAIQQALTEAENNGGGTVVFPPRMYRITDFLVVGSGTHVWAYGAHIRNTNGLGLIRNFRASDTAPGYTGKSDIRISGGIWDAYAWNGTDGVQTGVVTALNFVHGSNIVVRDVVVRDVNGGHAIEFNAVNGGTVTDSIFEGYSNGGDTARNISEAVQIDCALNIIMEPKDLTPARNITIERCVSRASDRLGEWGRFAGSHTGVQSQTMGAIYENITIRSCRIEGTLTWGIYGYGWQNVAIEDNFIADTAGGGIACVVPLSATWGYAMRVQNIRISGNKVVGSGSTGIWVRGDENARSSTVQIVGNQVIDTLNGDAILVEECGSPLIISNQIRNTDSGAAILTRSPDAVISGNVIYNTSTNGINAQRYDNAFIDGNLVHTTRANYGIFVGPGNGRSATSAVISNNKVINPAVAGIRLSTGAAGCTIANNHVRKGSGSATSGILNVSGATGCRIVGNDLAMNGWTAENAINVASSSPVTRYSGGSAIPGDNLI